MVYRVACVLFTHRLVVSGALEINWIIKNFILHHRKGNDGKVISSQNTSTSRRTQILITIPCAKILVILFHGNSRNNAGKSCLTCIIASALYILYENFELR
jgi:hypothetical protein